MTPYKTVSFNVELYPCEYKLFELCLESICDDEIHKIFIKFTTENNDKFNLSLDEVRILKEFSQNVFPIDGLELNKLKNHCLIDWQVWLVLSEAGCL